MSEIKHQTVKLKRNVNLPFLVFYGLGAIIGGGIYALIGKVAGIAGDYMPVSFLVSSMLAMVSALSYAELSSRHPLSAGEVRYVGAAFNNRFFCIIVGWLIVFTAIISSAVLIKATNGFIQDLHTLPEVPLTLFIIAILGAIAAWGITQSVAFVTMITLVEIGGLLLVIVFCGDKLPQLFSDWPRYIPPSPIHDLSVWVNIFSGAFLAFYAFIGFEDMVNIAEEVKDAKKTLPRAILICFCLTLIIYVMISLVAVLSSTPADLAESKTPLATILSASGSPVSPAIMIAISILAAINGVLVQIIMAARILYGMGTGGEAPVIFANVNSVTQTPLFATFCVIASVILFALLTDLLTLAKLASGIIIFIFGIVNLALFKIKVREGKSASSFSVPLWLPLAGFFVCGIVLIFEIWQWLF